MGHLIILKSSISEVIGNISWVFYMGVLLGAVIMMVIDYFKGKIK
jgi:hypothetical protein